VSSVIPTAPAIDAKVDTLEIDASITFNDWRRYGERLLGSGDTLAWYIGDWWNFGQDAFAMDYHDALANIVADRATVLECARVARAFPPRRAGETAHRISEITFACHQVLASVKDPEERMAWLEDVLRQGWTHRDLRRELQNANLVERRLPDALSVKLVDDHYRLAVAAAESRGMDPKDWLLEQIRIGAERDGIQLPELEAA
jgi:hypothetical protein